MLTLSVPHERLSVMRPFGRPVAVTMEDGKVVVPVGRRTYLRLRSTNPKETADLLVSAAWQ